MDAGISTAKSILAKPLKLLTEEDISQLTREDCRNFLFEKGMRRPSWNKSQAIQQVLSLKALFEPGDDSGASILRKILVSPPPRVTTTSIDPSNELGASGRIPFQEDNGARDSPRSAEFSGGSSQFVAEKDSYRIASPSPRRSPGEANAVLGQMTIFYSGKVNVYDGVPSDKAKSIMNYAANTNDFASNRIMSKEKMVEFSQYGHEKANDVEGQANRKVSLQRYLEKRKDRRFSKTKKAPPVASSSVEMFLNPQPRNNAAYSQNLGSLGDTHGNQTTRSNLSVDLNNEDM